MTRQWSEDGESQQVTRLLEEALSRRDLGRFAAVAAGLAGMTPTLNPSFLSPITHHPSPSLQDDRGGTIILARAADANTLDPHHTILGLALHVLFCVYDTLTVVNPDGQVEGVLAESWDISDDGLEYTFHLRPNITFHDGTPFNADAVKFTYDRILDPATNTPTRSWLTALKETIVVDDATVKMILSEPFSPSLATSPPPTSASSRQLPSRNTATTSASTLSVRERGNSRNGSPARASRSSRMRSIRTSAPG